VLLHGLTFDHRMWLPALAVLRERDPSRQLLVLDLPGHGGSPMVPIRDLDDVAAAVASAIDEAHLEAPVLVGHSISAVIAGLYAATYPVSGLVDVDQELDTSFVGILQANRHVVTGPGFGAMWPGILASMHIEQLPPEAQSLLSTDLPRQDVVLAYWREALETPLAELDARAAETFELLRRSETPVLIVAGHAYHGAYSSWLRDEIPQATVTVLPRSGHFPQLGHPEAFADLLTATGRWRRPAHA
jgi:pimeloyl-ACP methyl ester carboxylesterase